MPIFLPHNREVKPGNLSNGDFQTIVVVQTPITWPIFMAPAGHSNSGSVLGTRFHHFWLFKTTFCQRIDCVSTLVYVEDCKYPPHVDSASRQNIWQTPVSQCWNRHLQVSDNIVVGQVLCDNIECSRYFLYFIFIIYIYIYIYRYFTLFTLIYSFV